MEDFHTQSSCSRWVYLKVAATYLTGSSNVLFRHDDNHCHSFPVNYIIIVALNASIISMHRFMGAKNHFKSNYNMIRVELLPLVLSSTKLVVYRQITLVPRFARRIKSHLTNRLINLITLEQSHKSSSSLNLTKLF